MVKRTKKPLGKVETQALQLESLLFSLKQIREGRRDPPMLFSFSFSDVIKNQVYLNFYGITAENVRNTKQISYDTTGNLDSQYAVDDPAWIAQTFTVGSSDIYVSTIEIYCDNAGDGSDNMSVEIQKTTTGEPNGKRVDYDNQTVSHDSPDWKVYSFDKIRLEAGQTYALVMKSSNASSDVYYDSVGSSFSGGSVWTTPDSGTNWTEDSGADIGFRINGKTTNPYKLFPASGITSEDVSTITSTVAIAEDDLLSDIDFDFEIQHTIAVHGLALLEIDTAGGYDVITLYKYDGTTETQLATATTDSSTLVSLDITTQTVIKRGDKLRLTIQMKADAVGAITYTLKHSGADLKLSVPVKLIGDI